jgi:hypothetical protein
MTLREKNQARHMTAPLSLPGLTRQSGMNCNGKSRIMDARVKPAHDAESVVHTIGA